LAISSDYNIIMTTSIQIFLTQLLKAQKIKNAV